MLVNFITDEFTKISTIRSVVEPYHRIVPIGLGSNVAPTASADAVVVDADLHRPDRIDAIRTLLNQFDKIPQKLFVVQKRRRLSVAQAYALGATDIVVGFEEVLFKLALLDASQDDARSVSSTPSPELNSSAEAFASMFASVRDSTPINLSDAERATAQIVNSVAQNGLTSWLDEVRKYHEGTFQHCLLVTGIAAGFALSLSFSSQDVQRLALAATLHDVGKASIPIEILDKPGRLDVAELEMMRCHPVTGYDTLKDVAGVSLEVLDGVRHHHELLDGSGYPDALTASQISDLVRLLTISDIFAALIEARSYKPPMPREEAYSILCKMDGKLEMPLVRAFKNVATATRTEVVRRLNP